MPTNARYFPNLAANPSRDKSLTLIFDYLGSISFYSLNLLQTVNYGKNQTILLSDITNASILYGVASSLEKEVGSAIFSTIDTVQNALVAKMNAAIENKEEVALEIINSWQKLSKLIQSKSHHHDNKNSLPTIADFPEKINDIIYTLLNHQNNQIKKLNLVNANKKASERQPVDLKSLSQLCLTLECITRNIARAPFCFKLDVKSLLFKLAKQVDAYVCLTNDKVNNDFIPLQELLQKELINKNGNWLTELITYLNFELLDNDPPELDDDLIDEKSINMIAKYPSHLSNAIVNLLKNEFSTPSKNPYVKHLLESTRGAMQLEKTFIASLLKRENVDASELLSDNRLQEATHFALRKAAISNKIKLEPSAIYKFKTSYYDYRYFNFLLNHFSQLLGISQNQVDIFGFVLTKLAKIPQFPTFCIIDEEQTMHPQNLIFPTKNIIIELDLSSDNIKALVDFLNINYGNNSAASLVEFNSRIKVDLITLIEKILPDCYHCLVITLLKDNRIKDAYQLLNSYLTPTEDLFIPFQNQCTTLEKPFSFLLFVTTLLKAFNIDEKPSYIEMYRNETRTDALLDIDIYLGSISLASANELVRRINTAFPGAYATVQDNKSDNECPGVYQHISIDKALFLNAQFNNLLIDTLNQSVPQRQNRSNISSSLFNEMPERPRRQPDNLSNLTNCTII